MNFDHPKNLSMGKQAKEIKEKISKHMQTVNSAQGYISSAQIHERILGKSGDMGNNIS
jgi:hypothetical protein